MINLHNFQEETLSAIQQSFLRGYQAPLCSLFTGAGKTEIFIEYIHRHIDLTKHRVIVLVPANLVMQTYQRFLLRHPEWRHHLKVEGMTMVKALGVVMNVYDDANARIIIGSVATLIDREPEQVDELLSSDVNVVSNRIERKITSTRPFLVSKRFDKILEHGYTDYVIYDEAHHAVSEKSFYLLTRLKQIGKLLNRDVKLVGFTATPFREDGVGLHNVFDCFAIQKSIRWGIQHNFLADTLPPIRIHAHIGEEKVDTLGVDDWAVVLKRAYIERGDNRPTIGFMPSVESARHIAEVFRDGNILDVEIPSAFVESEDTVDFRGRKLKKSDRDKIYTSFCRGETRAIFNYGVILEGVDLPPASCMIWARPAANENVVLGTQALGRVLRKFDGDEFLPKKENVLILLATDSDLTVLNMGTLAGYKLDNTGQAYIETETFDTEETTEVVDIRDSSKDMVIESDGISYSIGKLIRRSESDWYHDDNNVQTLSISKTDALIITHPNYTLARSLKEILLDIEKLLEVNYNLPNLKEMYEQVFKAVNVLDNYALWHTGITVTKTDPVRVDESLQMLMNYAIPYAQQVGDPVESFYGLKKSWKRKPATDKQTRMLTSMRIPFEVDVTAGEAAQLITYQMHYKQQLMPIYSKIVNQAKILINSKKKSETK